MASVWDWIGPELTAWQSRGLHRPLKRRESPPVAGQIQLDGNQLINFGSNDYLGIAADSRIVDTVKRFAGYHGWGSGASPLVSGRGTLHEELEADLADFEGTQSALVFPTGFAANVGTLTSLTGEGDMIFSDRKNHASIIDGCRLSNAQTQVFAHRDMTDLSRQLEQSRHATRRLIVTDALFSMDGDLAPLCEIAQLAEQYDAMLVIDEAHGTGVFGKHGRGVHEALGCATNNLLVVGTLSKALGSLGGFVAGPREVIEWIWNRARTYMFSTAAPDVVCAATRTALQIVRDEPFRRVELLERSQNLRDTLRSQGWNLGDSDSQIIPLLMGTPDRAIQASAALRESGFFVPAIRPPAVPADQSLLRLSLSWDHSPDMLQQLVDALEPLKPLA